VRTQLVVEHAPCVGGVPGGGLHLRDNFVLLVRRRDWDRRVKPPAVDEIHFERSLFINLHVGSLSVFPHDLAVLLHCKDHRNQALGRFASGTVHLRSALLIKPERSFDRNHGLVNSGPIWIMMLQILEDGRRERH
jgi:hypothetical protein